MANSIQSDPNEDDTIVRVYCVEPGTLVGQDEDGNDLIVTESMAVNIGSTWWLTKPAFGTIRHMAAKRVS